MRGYNLCPDGTRPFSGPHDEKVNSSALYLASHHRAMLEDESGISCHPAKSRLGARGADRGPRSRAPPRKEPRRERAAAPSNSPIKPR